MYLNNSVSTMAQEGRASPAVSVTTYHSFIDTELLEPISSPPTTSYARPPLPPLDIKMEHFAPPIVRVQRKDSGYESHGTSPRNSASYSRPPPVRRMSLVSNSVGGQSRSLRSRIHPLARRSTTGNQAPATYQLRTSRPSSANPPGPVFQLPAADLVKFTETNPEPPSPPPPQTTHYWTSDSTRRLEYAAIDAASQGVKGWLRRHLLPDCFVGKEKHVPFDDDSGSVRRYRLDLDEGQDEKFASFKGRRPQRKNRLFSWPLRKCKTF